MPKLRFTLKAWPVIAIATIGLCFTTELVAGWFGIKLPEQTNVEVVKRVLVHAFDDGFGFYCSRRFWGAALLIAEVVAIMPVIEELIFRGLLFKLPCRWMTRRARRSRPTDVAADQGPRERLATGSLSATVTMIISSLLFSAAHYIFQPWPDNAFIALCFFGLAQCRLYRKTERIWCAMLNHAMFNLTNLVLLFLLPQA